MMMNVRFSAVAAALFLASCAHAPAATPPPAPGSLQVIEANPAKGFNFPYLLRVPAAKPQGTTFLLVEPNNTGKVSDNLAVHMDAATKLAGSAIGGFVAKRLDLPLLVPVFPRSETNWQIYTHLLDRDAMLIREGPSRRHDLQLIAMIRDAQTRLGSWDIPVEEKVLLTGFSASGSFVNRFTAMHPQRVAAAATGGLNGLLIVPSATLDSVPLGYPLGVADLESIAGVRFDRERWKRVPQFIYHGADDTNDAVQFDDGYSEEERATVYRLLGERMQPGRWARCQAIYRDAGANVTFRTYPGVGHWTDGKINGEIADFFRGVIVAAK